MIEARGLCRRFGGRGVLTDVTFAVAPGEVVGFLGPNGAGKTTTMRLLLGLARADGGTAQVDGPVGYLPEHFVAYDALTVRGYLRHCSRMKRLDRATSNAAVDAVLGTARLEDLARRPVARLSKGQRQRLGLAQALLGAPAALVLDEPTIGLDPAQVVDARRALRSAADGGAAVLVSTHLLAEAAAIADRVVVLDGGRVVAEERPGPTSDLEARYLALVAGTADVADKGTDAGEEAR